MNNTRRAILWALWLAAAAFGLFGLHQRFIVGRELTNQGSYVPWGLWVTAYVYFIGLSAGAFLLSSMVYVFRIEALRKIGRLALFTAVITLGMALVCILFDLGQIWRFYEVLTRPNFQSMMAWMVWLYSAYFILILAELWFEMRGDLATLAERRGPSALLYRALALGWRRPTHPEALAASRRQSERWLRRLAAIGIPLAIAFHGGVGALFATLVSRPYWHQSLFPILFLTGALVSGGALLLAAVAVFGRGDDPGLPSTLRILGRTLLGLLLLDLLLEASETAIPMWYGVGPGFELYKWILFGKGWWIFWIVHLLLGSLIPIALLIWRPASRWVLGVAASLVAVTFLSVRLKLIVPGQVTPALEGLRDAYVHPRLLFDYVPSLHEWAIISFVVAAGFAVFYLGYTYLPLTAPSGQEAAT